MFRSFALQNRICPWRNKFASFKLSLRSIISYYSYSIIIIKWYINRKHFCIDILNKLCTLTFFYNGKRNNVRRIYRMNSYMLFHPVHIVLSSEFISAKMEEYADILISILWWIFTLSAGRNESSFSVYAIHALRYKNFCLDSVSSQAE